MQQILFKGLNANMQKYDEYVTETKNKQDEYAKTVLHFKDVILKKEESINKSAAMMSAMEENITLMTTTLNDSRTQRNALQKSSISSKIDTN